MKGNLSKRYDTMIGEICMVRCTAKLEYTEHKYSKLMALPKFFFPYGPPLISMQTSFAVHNILDKKTSTWGYLTAMSISMYRE